MDAFDAIAARTVGWVEPIRFSLAQSTAEKEIAYHLRYQAVIERGWHQPQDFPTGLEYDAHDEHALHVLGWDGDTAIATSRLVLPIKGRLLPIEESFDLTIEPRGQVVDAGRFVVMRTHSTLEHRVLGGLMCWSWLALRERGFSDVCSAFASASMLKLYQRMGLQVNILASARHYWGELRYPIRWDVFNSAPQLLRRWRHVQDIAKPAK